MWLLWNRAQYLKVEGARRQNERDFNRFFNSGPVAIAMLDPLSLHIVKANAKFCHLHGYNEGEMLGMHLQDFTPPEDYAAEIVRIQAIMSGGSDGYTMEKRQIRKDGSVLWIRVSGCPLKGEADEPPLLTGILEDITEEKTIREALRKSEEQLHTLLDNIPGGVFRCKVGDTWPVVFVTEGVSTLTGYSISEYLDGSFEFTKIIHPDDLPRFDEVIQNAIETHSIYEMIYRIYHADGGIHWLHERGCAVYDDHGQPVFLDGVAIDVTERHLIDEALLESERRFRTLAENVPDVIARMDTSLRYVFINPAVEQASGIKIEEYLHKTPAEMGMPKNIADYWEQNTREVFQSGQQKTAEFEFPTPNGLRTFQSHVVPEFALDGTVQTVLVVSRDITDIIRIEQELEQRTEEVDSFFNASLDLMCIADTQGHFRRLNPVWEKTLGYSIDELQGQRFLQFVHPDDLGPTLEVMAALANQQTISNFTNRYRKKDGTYRWIEWSSRQVGNMMFASARDITDRLNSEAERLDLERRIQQSQKMESLGVLAGGIAHDFNNLLTVILGNLDLVQESVGPDSPLQTELTESTHAAKRAAELTRQMLAYVGKGRFVIRNVNLNELVIETAQLLAVSIPKTVAVRYELDPHTPHIQADSSQIQQVITNLLMNAIEAIGENTGTITLRNAPFEVDEDFLARYRLEQEISRGCYAGLEVSDTGCGMPLEVQRKIFDPFYSTKFAGRGLGLPAVLGIIRAQKGAITVDSQEGEGTRVRVLLPLQDDDQLPQPLA